MGRGADLPTATDSILKPCDTLAVALNTTTDSSIIDREVRNLREPRRLP